MNDKAKAFGMEINAKMTNLMVISKDTNNANISVGGKPTVQVLRSGPNYNLRCTLRNGDKI